MPITLDNTDDFAKADLPLTEREGQLRRVTDVERGLWKLTAHHWYGLTGEVVNAKEFVTSGAGTDGDPWRGWDTDTAALINVPLYFPPGVYGTTGVLIDANTDHVNWRGAGMGDLNTGFRTVIKGITSGTNTHILKTDNVRYVTLSDMAFDGDDIKDSCIIVDAAINGISGMNWSNLYLHEATTRTVQLAPTASKQVDQSAFTNCWFVSTTPTDSQVFINSTNAVNLSFYNCAFAGAGNYGIRLDLGIVSLYDCVFSANKLADIFFNSESCTVFANRCHSESLGLFLSAPAATPVADFHGPSSRFFGINHAVFPTAGSSVNVAQGRVVEIHNSNFGGDVVVTSPQTVYVNGVVTFANKSNGVITAFADAGNGFTTVTDTAHGLINNDVVTISGTTSYNGTFIVSAVAANTFDIGVTFVANDATGTWIQKRGFTGTGAVQRWRSVNDPPSDITSGARSPHCITNRLGVGTSQTVSMLSGHAYFPNARGLLWTTEAGSTFGGGFEFRHVRNLTNNSTQVIGLGSNTPNAVILIYNVTDQTMAMFSLNGGNNSTTQLLDPSNTYNTVSTANETSIEHQAAPSAYIIRNREGATKTYLIWYFTGTA